MKNVRNKDQPNGNGAHTVQFGRSRMVGGANWIGWSHGRKDGRLWLQKELGHKFPLAYLWTYQEAKVPTMGPLLEIPLECFFYLPIRLPRPSPYSRLFAPGQDNKGDGRVTVKHTLRGK